MDMKQLAALQQSSNQAEQPEVKMEQFTAQHGSLTMRETRDIAFVRCNHGTAVQISTNIFASARSVHGNTSYAVRFAIINGEGAEQGSNALGIEEVEELTDALQYMGGLSQQMLTQERDYTEVTYLTKEGMKFGYYHLEGQQQIFLDVNGQGLSAFGSIDRLQSIESAVRDALQHLQNRGAAVAGKNR